MPIEIKEMHIKISVNDQGESKPATNDSSNKDQLIEECLEEVTRILKNKDER